MKKHFILLLFFTTIAFTNAQETKKSKFQVIGAAGIGFAIIESNNEPNYNLSTNFGGVLLNYKLSKKNRIGIGLTHNQLTGNGFNAVGNFYHERSFLKIPVVYSMDYKLTEKITYISSLGFYGQTIIKDQYQFLNNTQKNIYGGWNFGIEGALSFVFQFSNYLSGGIQISGQADLSKFNTKSNQIISDSQKVKNQNAIGFLFLFNL